MFHCLHCNWSQTILGPTLNKFKKLSYVMWEKPGWERKYNSSNKYLVFNAPCFQIQFQYFVWCAIPKNIKQNTIFYWCLSAIWPNVYSIFNLCPMWYFALNRLIDENSDFFRVTIWDTDAHASFSVTWIMQEILE